MGRPDKIRTAYLDASSLLGVVTGDADFVCLHAILRAIDQGDVELFASAAMLTEVRPRHVKDDATRARARESVLALLESRETRLVDVSTVVARKAGDLAVEHGLKTLDAIHLATAILSGVDVLIVRDHRFPKGNVEGVWVTEPFDLNEGTLFGLLPPEV